MPMVCHQLPLKFDEDDPDDDDVVLIGIDAWDASRWNDDDPTADHENWMRWWCVDVPEAYSGSSALYVTMEDTLRGEMGDAAYEQMVSLIEEQKPAVAPMPGSVRNDGRPLLPVLIGNRTPKRPNPDHDHALKEMQQHGDRII